MALNIKIRRHDTYTLHRRNLPYTIKPVHQIVPYLTLCSGVTTGILKFSTLCPPTHSIMQYSLQPSLSSCIPSSTTSVLFQSHLLCPQSGIISAWLRQWHKKVPRVSDNSFSIKFYVLWRYNWSVCYILACLHSTCIGIIFLPVCWYTTTSLIHSCVVIISIK